MCLDVEKIGTVLEENAASRKWTTPPTARIYRQFCYLAATLLSSVAMCPQASAQDTTRAQAAENWSSYNRTVAGDRFSPLDEIDRDNVGKLVRKCEYSLP